MTRGPDLYSGGAGDTGNGCSRHACKKNSTCVPFDLKRLASLLARVSAKINKRMADREAMLEKINALPKMGSYAWVLSGKKTASGRVTIYSGPQMGFDTPAICQEGSIVSAGLNISGMAIPGLPGIVIGRTPHHAWSMQVGHAHTVDYYIEPPPGIIDNYYTSRTETINVAGTAPVTITVYRTPHGRWSAPWILTRPPIIRQPMIPLWRGGIPIGARNLPPSGHFCWSCPVPKVWKILPRAFGKWQ
ncbi:MAG: penicillin acylase family protein [Desulfobacterales bacterium]